MCVCSVTLQDLTVRTPIINVILAFFPGTLWSDLRLISPRSRQIICVRKYSARELVETEVMRRRSESGRPKGLGGLESCDVPSVFTGNRGSFLKRNLISDKSNPEYYPSRMIGRQTSTVEFLRYSTVYKNMFQDSKKARR
jgi:hypothetical protein